MNYYKQGDAADADKIKAAFEKLGYDTVNLAFTSSQLYYTIEGEVKLMCTKALQNLIKTHPDYQELELPKPHYDIANFKPKQWVLVRDDDEWEWALTRFSYLSNGSSSLFVCINGASFQQCIPFDSNERLLGTTKPCGEEYINW